MENVIKNPDPNWIERLRTGNKVWLAKEQQIAVIEYPYEPEVGHKTGRIGVKRYIDGIQGAFIDEVHYITHPWFITLDGCGIDGSLLMLPIEGELADNPAPLEEPIVRQLIRTIQKLEKRVNSLELSRWRSIYNVD